jgi:hypothetical protein
MLDRAAEPAFGLAGAARAKQDMTDVGQRLGEFRVAFGRIAEGGFRTGEIATVVQHATQQVQAARMIGIDVTRPLDPRHPFVVAATLEGKLRKHLEGVEAVRALLQHLRAQLLDGRMVPFLERALRLLQVDADPASVLLLARLWRRLMAQPGSALSVQPARRARILASAWPCSWHTRDSVTPKMSPISPQVEFLLVIERHHQLFAFGQSGDRLRQVPAKGGAAAFFRRPRLAAGHGLLEIPIPGELREAEQASGDRVARHRVIFVDSHFQHVRDFVWLRLPARPALHRANGLRDAARIPVDRSRRPLIAPHLVQHCAAYPDAGKSLETRALRGVEVVGRFQQPDRPGLDQVFELHIGGQPAHQVAGNSHHQPEVLLDQLVVIRHTDCGVHGPTP